MRLFCNGGVNLVIIGWISINISRDFPSLLSRKLESSWNIFFLVFVHYVKMCKKLSFIYSSFVSCLRRLCGWCSASKHPSLWRVVNHHERWWKDKQKADEKLKFIEILSSSIEQYHHVLVRLELCAEFPWHRASVCLNEYISIHVMKINFEICGCKRYTFCLPSLNNSEDFSLKSQMNFNWIFMIFPVRSFSFSDKIRQCWFLKSKLFSWTWISFWSTWIAESVCIFHFQRKL